MIETGVLVNGNHEAIYWHLPKGRSGGSLPDDPGLWAMLWAHREQVLGFAHTHPGAGLPWPSDTDLSTFLAIEAALGRRLVWWIASSTHLVACHWERPHETLLGQYAIHAHVTDPPWLAPLRLASEYRLPEHRPSRDPMNPKYLLLAARLLEEASRAFSNHGCNDCELKELSKAEALAFVREAYVDNDPKGGLHDFDEAVEAHRGDVRQLMPDWWVMSHLAKKLRDEAERDRG